jgi:hypothetical protein
MSKARMGQSKSNPRGSPEEEERGWRKWLPKIIGPIAWLLAKLAERLMVRLGL